MVQLETSKGGLAQSLTRRTFLQGTLVSSTALVAGCASTVNKPTTLNWICEEGYQGDIKSFQMLAHMYSALNKDQVTIEVRERTKHERLQQMFTDPVPAKRAQYDILSLDVVWTSEFASNGWVIPLDRYWPDYNKTNLYLPITLKAASYHNKLYAAPLHSDVGVLYYRTDFSDIIKPENIKSWDELASMALEAQQEKSVHSGFTWQALPFEPSSGTVFEGLMCNF